MHRLLPAAVAVLLTLSGCAVSEQPLRVPNPTATVSGTTAPTPPPPAPRPDVYRVERVVDGDTVRIIRDGQSVPLRLIGGDTPETVHPWVEVECYGQEASDEAKQLLTGQQVLVYYDPTQGDVTEDGRRVDKYDRDLVYLELPDGTDFMRHMITQGFAEEYRYRTDYRRMAEYRAAEEEAKTAGRGLWSACR